MKKILLLILSAFCMNCYSQIFYTYDDAGNRDLRTIDMTKQVLNRNDSTSENDSTIVEKRTEITYNFSNDSKITVFPNPVKQTLNIQTENINAIEISVIDFVGKTLLSKKSNDSWNLLDLSMLPPGNYILSTIADGKKMDWKIIKD